jgi:hypothetical protein
VDIGASSGGEEDDAQVRAVFAQVGTNPERLVDHLALSGAVQRGQGERALEDLLQVLGRGIAPLLGPSC